MLARWTWPHTVERLRQALDASAAGGLPRYESLQPHYNLVERPAYEGALEDLCRKEELGVISYRSLAAGFLTGKYRSEVDLSKSPRGNNVKKYLTGGGLGVLAAVEEVAKRLGATPGQVAIAWIIARPGVTAPIASATGAQQLEELIGAAQIQLDGEAMAALDRASGAASTA